MKIKTQHYYVVLQQPSLQMCAAVFLFCLFAVLPVTEYFVLAFALVLLRSRYHQIQFKEFFILLGSLVSLLLIVNQFPVFQEFSRAQYATVGLWLSIVGFTLILMLKWMCVRTIIRFS